MKFVNRDFELSSLHEKYHSDTSEFIVIYGRRRVGKTTIIKEFLTGKKHFYFLADMQKENQLLSTFSEVARIQSGKEYINFTSWDAFFSFLKEESIDRTLVVFDEVGYINRANPAFYSILQRYWDEHFCQTKMMLILCGSSVSMMERDVLGYGSPLYGRRTGQLEVYPFDYVNVRKFFPDLNEEEVIETYAVTGGVPAYMNHFQATKDVLGNISNQILRPDAFLYREPRFILLEELRDPTTYMSILRAIAQGAGKFNEISQKSGVATNKLSKYLSVLMDLRLVRREIPITEKKDYTRHSLYSISDNLFSFWFRFVYPYTSLIEGNDISALEDIISSNFNVFVSRIFEDVSKQMLMNFSSQKKVPAFNRFGRWWHKGQEIDIVAINESTCEIMFAECKWQNKKIGMREYNALLEKSNLVNWRGDGRICYYAFFSKSGFEPSFEKFAEEKGIFLFSLKDFRDS